MSSNMPERQTTVFMNEREGQFRGVLPSDTTSAGRLLSTSDDSRGKPQQKMTRVARRRVRIILMTMLVVILAILLTVISILALPLTSGDTQSFEETDKSLPLTIPTTHIRCNNDVIISDETTHQYWRHYNKTSRHWRQIPNIKHTGYVLISPRLRLENDSSGILLSMLLRSNDTKFYAMAVSIDFRKHSKPVLLRSPKNCESIAIDDPNFFTGNETLFRVYVYYARYFPLRNIKFTITSLPTFTRFKSLTFDEESSLSTKPQFVEINVGERAHCSLELHKGIPYCSWWNIEDWDDADFIPADISECMTGGVSSYKTAIYYLGLELNGTEHETRALLISPIIKRETNNVVLTLWYIFKCTGTKIRIHRIPATRSTWREAMGSSTVVATITEPAGGPYWEFQSFEIKLPKSNNAYQIVIEGILAAEGNCSESVCSAKSRRKGKEPLKPFIGLDSMALEPLSDRCHPSNGTSIMDCGFQTNTSEATTCEWSSSYLPPWKPLLESGRATLATAGDWKPENSAWYRRTHGALERHYKGRGYIMSYDAAGNAHYEPYMRTPLLIASSSCSCIMKFRYLMRGRRTPRMQLNMIYGKDMTNEMRDREPQWSLFGHQGDDWKLAVVTINLVEDYPFQVEIRVLDVETGDPNLHFDDIKFDGCAIKKYSP